MVKARLLEDNLGEQLYELRIGSDFEAINTKPKSQRKIFYYTKIKFYSSKNIMKKVKKQATK